MSGFITYRKVADEDIERLNASATAFAARHNLALEAGRWDQEPVWERVDTLVDEHEAQRWPGDPSLKTLWLGCFRRAVRHPRATGIGWGYIGRSADN